MPLTPEEHVQLQALLQKASKTAEVDIHSNPGSDGGFSMIPDVTQGAMTDGAKRREASPLDQPSSKRGGVSYAGAEIDMKNNPRGMMPGYTPDVEPPCVPYADQRSDMPVMLPPKVPNTETWGRTILTWGQYKGCNVSYEELYNRTDEKAVGYKKWCLSRINSAEGRLLDLIRFLRRRDQESTSSSMSQGPVIPGTSEVRTYK